MSRLDERRQRVLTTHTGSLPRPDALAALLFARMTRQPYDASELAHLTIEAIAAVVKTQVDLCIDIVSDGEQSKTSFQAYAADRLAGIEPITPEPGERRTRENTAFPTFYRDGAHSGSAKPRWACTGPIKYIGQKALATDLQNLKRALQGASSVDAFMPSVSPSSCASFMQNRYYKSDEDHVLAVAEAMRVEYEAIAASGFQVQIDDPRLAMHYMLSPDEDLEKARAWAWRRVDVLNHALRNIPPERVRHHTCYGINMGPRVSDMEMKHLADIIVTIRAGFYSFEMANPRHEHEWQVWEHVKLPDDKVLIPGCITHASVIVEHPELVAERIVRLAKLVGRERVIAGTDCGFASTLVPGQRPEIEAEIVWAKFKSLADGARIASELLWA
ncbi:MAG TPA: cobalamin-independent methionine synthase II family protein [Xanthobacteraceae bacterium]|nr:cobalamin-independent methionine synthase II family protein [Xanthobacteraceae bacterium]